MLQHHNMLCINVMDGRHIYSTCRGGCVKTTGALCLLLFAQGCQRKGKLQGFWSFCCFKASLAGWTAGCRIWSAESQETSPNTGNRRAKMTKMKYRLSTIIYSTTMLTRKWDDVFFSPLNISGASRQKHHCRILLHTWRSCGLGCGLLRLASSYSEGFSFNKGSNIQNLGSQGFLRFYHHRRAVRSPCRVFLCFSSFFRFLKCCNTPEMFGERRNILPSHWHKGVLVSETFTLRVGQYNRSYLHSFSRCTPSRILPWKPSF